MRLRDPDKEKAKGPLRIFGNLPPYNISTRSSSTCTGSPIRSKTYAMLQRKWCCVWPAGWQPALWPV